MLDLVWQNNLAGAWSTQCCCQRPVTLLQASATIPKHSNNSPIGLCLFVCFIWSYQISKCIKWDLITTKPTVTSLPFKLAGFCTAAVLQVPHADSRKSVNPGTPQPDKGQLLHIKSMATFCLARPMASIWYGWHVSARTHSCTSEVTALGGFPKLLIPFQTASFSSPSLWYSGWDSVLLFAIYNLFPV